MNRVPSPRELTRIEEQLHRFGTAMMVCLTAAILVCLLVVNARGRIAVELLQQLASLGVALWLVGFVLAFFFAYYRAKRKLAMQ